MKKSEKPAAGNVRHEELRAIVKGEPTAIGAQTLRIYLSYSKSDLADKILDTRRAHVESWELGEMPVPAAAWQKLCRMVEESLRGETK